MFYLRGSSLTRGFVSRVLIASFTTIALAMGSATMAFAVSSGEETESAQSAQSPQSEQSSLPEPVTSSAPAARADDLSLTWQRYAGQSDTHSASAAFFYTGTVSCLETMGESGCQDGLLTIPVPDEEMPDGAAPFSAWTMSVYWVQSGTWLTGSLNGDGDAWQFPLPTVPGGETDTFTVNYKANTMYVPQSITFGLGVSISGSNFATVSSTADVFYTATMSKPGAEAKPVLISPASGSVLLGGEVTYQVTDIFGGTGLGTDGAAPLPGSVDISVKLPENTEFVSATQEGAIPGEYDPETHSVVFSGAGVTWQEAKAGTKQAFAPVVFKLGPDFKNDIFGNYVSGQLTSGIIGDPDATYTSAWVQSAKSFKMKTTIDTRDVISVGVAANQGFTGNRHETISGPLPYFEGQSSWSVVLGSLALPYKFDVQWQVPCRSGESPNVKIAGDAQCSSDYIAFTAQSIQLDTSDESLSFPATVTYTDGTRSERTEEITVGATPVPLTGKVTAVSLSGDMAANTGANVIVSGVFPDGSMQGTAVAEDPADTGFKAGAIWLASAAGIDKPLPVPTSMESTHAIMLATGSSVRNGTTVTAGGGFGKFANFVSDQAGNIEAAVLLPAGVDYTGWAPSTIEPSYEPEVFEDWDGNGSTLLRFKWDGAKGPFVDSGNISWQTPALPGHYPVTFMVNAGNNPFSGEQCWEGQTAGNPTTSFSKWAPTSGGLLENDADGVCSYTSYFDVSGDNATLIEGFVKPTNSPVWLPSPGIGWQDAQNEVGVNPGDIVDFQAVASNLARGNVQNPVVCLAIPNPNEVNPVTGKPLGTEYQASLVAKPNVPSGWSVEYSTDANACRDEFSGAESDAISWTSDPGDLAAVTSLRFSADVLPAGQSAALAYQLQLPDPGNEILNQVAWNIPALAFDSADGQERLLSHGRMVGIGDIERFNAWHGNLTAEVVGSDRSWARSGDTIQFTQTVDVSDDGLLDPDLALAVNLPQLEGATLDADSLSASTGSAVVDDQAGQIVWNIGPGASPEAVLSYQMVLGDNPPATITSSVEYLDGYPEPECPANVECTDEATLAVPQIWAELDSTPEAGSTVGLGDTIDYRVELTSAGIDAASGAAPEPTLTWDVADLSQYGQIEVAPVASGEVTYDEAAGTITWTGMSLDAKTRQAPTLQVSLHIADKAADLPGVEPGEPMTLQTSLAVEVADSFTPVHALTPLSAQYTLVAKELPGPVVPVPPTGSNGGSGKPDVNGTKPSGGLAATGTDAEGLLAAVALLMLLGGGALAVTRRPH